MDLIILVGAIIITWLLFSWLIKVIKTSLSTAVIIALLVLFLQLFFGVEPQQLWQQIQQFPDIIKNIFKQ